MTTMPHRDRDIDLEERPSERRLREKHEKDPSRPHKARSSRPKIIDPETGEVVRSPHRRRKEKDKDKLKEASSEPTRSMADAVPEMRSSSASGPTSSRVSLPYPSFSKAHSKEALHSREDIRSPPAARSNPYTPESTDVGSGDAPRSKSTESLKEDVKETKAHTQKDAANETKAQTQKDVRPPSPPDTEFSQQRKSSPPSRTSQLREEMAAAQSRSSSQASQRSWFGRTSARDKDDRSKLSSKSKHSRASTAVRMSKSKPAVVEIVEDDDDSIISEDAQTNSALDSNATSRAPPRAQSAAPIIRPVLDTDSSPESAQDSSPRTPTATPSFSHTPFKPTPSPFVSFDVPSSEIGDSQNSPMPPPPPPPPMVPMNIPRVDYLMQNGGLSRTVPKTLLSVTPSFASQVQSGMRTPAPSAADIEKVFSPFYGLLDQYETVIAKNGSIAVATGYRSVARRLLDRLENVFARDLSSEGCFCVICQQNDEHESSVSKGLGWGDVLEWVSNRRELPEWPAFNFGATGVKQDDLAGLGLPGRSGSGPGRPGSPVKMDPDIAEEFREHYLRQSKKTKAAVDKWLNNNSATTAAAPPPDVDDETLTFTILTHLEEYDRPIFNALMAGSSRPLQSVSRAPTPMGKPRSDFIIKTGLSLQRLYKLPVPPRDPESCIYLFKNPELHHLLATLSGINQSEWEILTSGRFDGFLWSGAESEFPSSMLNSPAISRNPTPAQGLPSRGPTPGGRQSSFSRIMSPFSSMGSKLRNDTFSPPIAGFPSRGPTPAGNFMAPTSMPPTPFQGGRQPVSNDEETEIAALAEVEREIYAGMEALEDAFEGLHRKAELVRQALRERGAGLSMMAQTRRGSGADQGVFARLSTPAFGERGWNLGAGTDSEVDVESDWGGDDTISELAPDDSASNISSSRHRRPKRRNERRTPAPVEEEDESEH